MLAKFIPLVFLLNAWVNGQDLGTGNCQLQLLPYSKRISCSGLKGENDLTKALDSFRTGYPGVTIQTLTIQGAENLLWLPGPETFLGTNLSSLSIENSTLPFWKSPTDKSKPKQSLRSLTSLNLNKVDGIYNWNWANVAEFSGNKIQSLSVSYSKWYRVRSDLSGLFGQHVTSLFLENNDIVTLDDNSLDCPSCTSINLQYNDIREISRQVFGSAPRRLIFLGLSGNKIKELPKDLFKNIKFEYKWTDTFEITLTGNPIKYLHKETFQPIVEAGLKKIMISFRMSQGALICNCGLKWLADKPFDISYFNCGASHTDPLNYIRLKDFLQENC